MVHGIHDQGLGIVRIQAPRHVQQPLAQAQGDALIGQALAHFNI
jgi:hypothetical protein